MDITADILLMLAAFSLRTLFIKKAIVYGQAGVAIYPEDHRFREILAYALLLDGKVDEAATVAEEAQRDTRNLAYLKARIAMLGNYSLAERQSALRAYLSKVSG